MMAGSLAKHALERLLAGNQRFAAGSRSSPRQSADHRRQVAAGQHPFAAVLGCADSRLSPEIIFDQGLGDLFAVRVAGHVLDRAVLGSLEFAVRQLGVPLVVVLGHSSCGAVQAAMAGGQPSGQMASLVEAILPAVELAQADGSDVLDQAVRMHVRRVVHQLRAAQPILAPLFDEGQIDILAAHYDLASGVVELLE